MAPSPTDPWQTHTEIVGEPHTRYRPGASWFHRRGPGDPSTGQNESEGRRFDSCQAHHTLVKNEDFPPPAGSPA
jgi:hypothetical protein